MGSIELPYSKQFIDNNDIDHVSRVLNSNYITSGPKIFQFEITNQVRYCNGQ